MATVNFEDNAKAIYLQIADRIANSIMRGDYDADSRLPSVREYAASVEVNANTVMRSYERLSSKGLIYNKRGIGFFVAPEAKLTIARERLEELMEKQLPPLFDMMSALGVTPAQLSEAYSSYIENHKKQPSAADNDPS